LAGKQDEGPHVCQFYTDQIEKYEKLRRGGESGSQMDNWKDKKRENERKFRDGSRSWSVLVDHQVSSKPSSSK